MTQTITIHSMRGGTGCSTISASLAKILACDGNKVGLIDLALAAPNLHKLFSIPQNQFMFTLNDVQQGEATIAEAVCTLEHGAGQIELLCADGTLGALARNLRDAERPTRLNKLLEQFSAEKNLDYLILDTATGITRESIIGLAAADMVCMVTTVVDQQEVALVKNLMGRIGNPALQMILNQVDPDNVEVRESAEYLLIYTDVPAAAGCNLNLPQSFIDALTATATVLA